MGHVLSDYCDVLLGYKSFLNDFFYLDAARIERFGVESEFLIPLYMLADLDHGHYRQTRAPKTWLFWCKREPHDLRGTGAGRYVDWGSQQMTVPRKQTAESVPWPQAPALSHSRHWYFPPAPTHPTRLAVRKGVNACYAPFVFDEPRVLDQRLYLMCPKGDLSFEVLAAYLASSLFALSLETNADLGLGEGVLTLGANNLRALPSVDLDVVEASPGRGEVTEAADALMECEPPEVRQLAEHPELRQLDQALVRALGFDPARAEELETAVIRLAEARLSRARQRSALTSQAARVDIQSVSDSVAQSLETWLKARQYPEDFMPGESTQRMNFPAGQLEIALAPMLDTCRVVVHGENGTILDDTLNLHVAEVLLRALQMGRRVFSLPGTADAAIQALHGFSSLLEEFEDQFAQVVAATGLGDRHRDAVLSKALATLHMPLRELRLPLQAGSIVVR